MPAKRHPLPPTTAPSAKVTTAPDPTKGPPSPWLLPDDGIVDYIAVEIAASGHRPVRLTRTERLLAAALILAAGGSFN
ncbi:hypothetical protein ACSNOI_47105, partial [Actinomadura kijaniata]|uniref:hypothetical protein n=1 Tax=Actinomadura kijaniata TaxID=46161 RepID=UPI003F1C25C1